MSEPRIAKIESRLDLIEFRINQHLAAEIEGKREILEAIAEIRDYQKKQKFFIGGVTFTIAATFSVAVALFKYFLPWFNNH
jgi:hypothetical protein